LKSQICKTCLHQRSMNPINPLALKLFRLTSLHYLILSLPLYDEIVNWFGQSEAKDVRSLLKWALASLRLNAHQHQKRFTLMHPSHTRLLLDRSIIAAVMNARHLQRQSKPFAQFASNPRKHQLDAVICIIRYLRTTHDWVLTLRRKICNL